MRVENLILVSNSKKAVSVALNKKKIKAKVIFPQNDSFISTCTKSPDQTQKTKYSHLYKQWPFSPKLFQERGREGTLLFAYMEPLPPPPPPPPSLLRDTPTAPQPSQCASRAAVVQTHYLSYYWGVGARLIRAFSPPRCWIRAQTSAGISHCICMCKWEIKMQYLKVATNCRNNLEIVNGKGICGNSWRLRKSASGSAPKMYSNFKMYNCYYIGSSDIQLFCICECKCRQLLGCV